MFTQVDAIFWQSKDVLTIPVFSKGCLLACLAFSVVFFLQKIYSGFLLGHCSVPKK